MCLFERVLQIAYAKCHVRLISVYLYNVNRWLTSDLRLSFNKKWWVATKREPSLMRQPGSIHSDVQILPGSLYTSNDLYQCKSKCKAWPRPIHVSQMLFLPSIHALLPPSWWPETHKASRARDQDHTSCTSDPATCDGFDNVWHQNHQVLPTNTYQKAGWRTWGFHRSNR